MADDRTDEQRAADIQLRDAVHGITAAYGDGNGWVPMEYLVVYSMTRFDDDGDACTAVGTAVDANTVPIHRLLGLLDYATIRLGAMVADDSDD